MNKSEKHPNINLKRLLDNLKDHGVALVHPAQKHEILRNKKIYKNEYIFTEDKCGLFLVSLAKEVPGEVSTYQNKTLNVQSSDSGVELLNP